MNRWQNIFAITGTVLVPPKQKSVKVMNSEIDAIVWRILCRHDLCKGKDDDSHNISLLQCEIHEIHAGEEFRSAISKGDLISLSGELRSRVVNLKTIDKVGTIEEIRFPFTYLYVTQWHRVSNSGDTTRPAMSTGTAESQVANPEAKIDKSKLPTPANGVAYSSEIEE